MRETENHHGTISTVRTVTGKNRQRMLNLVMESMLRNKTICFSFFFIFIGAQLLYNVALFSTVQQSESTTRIHISPFIWISFLERVEGKKSKCYRLRIVLVKT